MQLSAEQQIIVTAAEDGKSIIVNAVAGAGKTSTALAIARAVSKKSVLQVTYNRKLKQEVRKKVRNSGITNMVVNNYHGLCLDYYGCHTDIAMIEVIQGIRHPIDIYKTPRFDLMIVDEAQDCSPEYHKFLVIFSETFCLPNFQLIVMGDVMQSIYDFKLASPIYLTDADKLWPTKKFVQLGMSKSFRVSPEVAECINGMMNSNIIHSAKISKDPCKVTLISNYTRGSPKELKPILDDLITYKIRPADLMIILPSASSNFATSFINRLAKNKIPIYKQSDTEDSNNSKYSAGKVLVCTYHTSKGLERDTVVVFNFDSTYYSVYQPTKSPNELVPTLYVGMTRAIRRLYIVENGPRLPFLNTKVCSNLQVHYTSKIPRDFFEPSRETICVSKLIKFLPAGLMYCLNADIQELYTLQIPAQKCLQITQCVKNVYRTTEYVADLTGAAIGEMLQEYRTAAPCKVLEYLDSFAGNFYFTEDYVKRELEDIELLKDSGINYYLQLCNLAETCKSGHVYRYLQIQDYTWITCNQVTSILANLDSISSESRFRRLFARCISTKHSRITIVGEIDACALNGNSRTLPNIKSPQVVEIKCTKELTTDHKLQLIFYAWILQDLVADWMSIEFLLINGLTGETLQMKCNPTVVHNICTKILDYKTGSYIREYI